MKLQGSTNDRKRQLPNSQNHSVCENIKGTDAIDLETVYFTVHMSIHSCPRSALLEFVETQLGRIISYAAYVF